MSSSGDLETLYAGLFQVLDGLWFVELEKQFGFDKALELDKHVWTVFARKEAQRLVGLLKEKGEITGSDGPISILEKILPISIFNKTVQFKIERSGKDELGFTVTECKTLAGMRKIGRPDHQASTVCYDMGFTYYDCLARAIDPSFTVTCTFTPYTDPQGVHGGGLCGWRFTLGSKD
ncbi:MAG: hypothetical protein JW839_00345 [Candidatus Lokiarchaeota archaeon]|nr:hypothetical protein [Candidatus Lokiarchaeota archaeon]